MILVVAMGTGDARSAQMAELGRRAVARCGSDAVGFEYVAVGPRDVYNGVERMPALVVGGRVVAQGEVPKMRTVAAAIEDALAHALPDDLRPARADAPEVPRCDGCGRACPLTSPACRVGRERAEALGIRQEG